MAHMKQDTTRREVLAGAAGRGLGSAARERCCGGQGCAVQRPAQAANAHGA